MIKRHRLMENNITKNDIDVLIRFLKKKNSFKHNPKMSLILKKNGQDG